MPAKFPEMDMLPPHDDSESFGRRGSANGNGNGNGNGNSQFSSHSDNTTAFQNLNNDPGFGFNRGVNHDEIVISGISARLPESDNLQEFHDNLFNGVDMITDDGRRWTPGLHGLPTRSGKLKELDKFDATFFGVHAKQANLMDPQLRMLLELTFEAIVDAGVNPSSIRGSRTGVFIGASASESDEAWSSNPDEVNGYGLTGCCRAMFANRVSYTFDLKGPSFALDTACSSSLLALEQAVSAIRMGHCDAAIVGGVNLCLKPTSSLQFHRLSMLSPEGMCKAFDAAGNGYVRSEAAVVIYIRKSDLAKRSYATILHAKTNTDGYKEQGITFPSGFVQKTLLEEIYSEAGVSPSQVGYVEAHGTGTKVGDPQELNAIAEVFCKDRDPSKPLLIGSVKSNMGHSEPASGLCSIAKVILAMQKGVIPGNLHFNSPNPDIAALNDGRFKVVSQNTPWEGGILGVNSFGFGGANVHVILKTNPKKTPGFLSNSTPLLIPYSGRTKEAVEFTLKQVSSRPRDDELVSLLQEISREEIPGHQFRGYAVVRDDQVDLDVSPTNSQSQGGKPPVWFIFSGMGSQWSGMGRDLLQFKVFATSIRRSAETLTPHGIDLTDILLHGNEQTFDNVLKAFVSIAAIQVGLVDLLRSMGVTPDGIIGHSVGELGCAYADGCFTAEQTVMAAYARGKAILESKLPPGGMAAVGLTWEEAKLRCPSDVFPACHNAKDSVSVSGPIASVRTFVEELKADGIFAKEVNSSGQAFHSKYIADAGSKLRESLEKIIRVAKPRTERWISSSIPESSWNSALAKTSSVAYHVNNLLSPVLFQEALAHVPSNALVIEIAPHCLLQAILKRSVSSTCTNIGLMHRTNPDNAAYFLNSVGKMFNAGIHPVIGNLYKKMEFPVSIGASLISPLVRWDHSITWDVANFNQAGAKSGETVIEVNLANELDEFYAGHKIDGRILFPATGYMLLVWKTFAKLRGTTFDQLPVVFENLSFQRATILQKEGTVKFLINILDGTGEFQIQEGDSVAVSGFIRLPEDVSQEMLNLKPVEIPAENSKTKFIPLNKSDSYKELRLRGYDYAGLFQGIRSVDNEGVWAKLAWEENWVSFLDTMLQFTILSKPNRALYLPTRMQRVTIDPKAFAEFVAANANPETNTNEVPVLNYKNLNVVKCPGVEMRGLKASMAPRRQGAQASPKLEEYTFTPYFDDVNVKSGNGSGKAKIPVEKVVRLCVDLAMENTPALKFKVSEVLHSATNSVATIAQDVVLGQPMTQCEVTILTTKAEVAASSTLKELEAANSKIKLVTKEDPGKLVPEAGAHLVIVDDETLIAQTVSSLKEAGFLLFRTQTTLTSVPKDFTLVAHKLSNEGQFYLFRKQQEQESATTPLTPTTTTITTDHTNYAWVEDLKAAMKKAADEPAVAPLIYLLSQNVPENGILGLINCLKQEPGGNKIRCFFVRDKADAATLALNFQEPDFKLKGVLARDLIMNVFENGVWGSYRHFPLKSEDSSALLSVEHAYINSLMRGDLSSLRWIEGPLKYFKEEDQTATSELCSVYYAPLNFRDIMLATGKLPPDALPGDLAMQDCVLGLEFSGKNSKGKRVMGCVAARGLATTLLADPTFMWEVPDSWSLAEAATVPVVYATAYYALVVRGKMEAGDSVLIHSGSGGVGQAAISIALSMKCKVFTTVGSPEKRQLLKGLYPSLTDANFANSRDCSFEQHIMEETGGRGVDLVLNSLAGDKLQASVRCLAQHGRFLEIGKFDLSNNTPLGMSVFLQNVTFHGILLDALFDNDSADKRTVVKLVADGIKSGCVKPLPSSIFSDEQIEEAFRFMATGKHIGKVLLRIRSEDERGDRKVVKAIPRSYFDSDKSYVIIGGLGGFGLELAGWLIERGVKKLVLVSRSGVTTGYQDLCLRKWRSSGITVTTPKADVTTFKGAENLLQDVIDSLGPLGGIFNLAMVLRDAFIENQTPEDFDAVAKPKINATLHLDKISRKLASEMDYFVVFSSVSCGRGNAGQSNYGFANSFMERICEARQKDGLSGLAIQWGAIGDVGVIQESMGGNETVVGGTLPQRIQSCLNAIDTFLQQPKPTVASMVLADKSGGKKDGGGKKVSLAESVAHILGMKDISNVNTGASLAELGMDSLMGVEVKQLMERDVDLVLSMNEIRQLTIGRLREIEAGTSGEEDSKRRSSVENVQYVDRPDDSAQIKMYLQELMPKQSIVKMESKSDGAQILFLVHPIEGVVISLKSLAAEVGSQVYGLQCVQEAPIESVESLAAYYIQQIKTIQPEGPYDIAGYSFGCTISLEMALQLEAGGSTVRNLIFLDGSHKYVSVMTEEYLKKNNTKTLELETQSEADALCTFLMQFMSFEYLKLRAELLEIPNLDGRLGRVAELLKAAVPQLNVEDIQNAAYSFYNKLVAADKYQPGSQFQGKPILIKALGNKAALTLGHDYSLTQVCRDAVEIHEVSGNHRSFIEQPSASKIASLINQTLRS